MRLIYEIPRLNELRKEHVSKYNENNLILYTTELHIAYSRMLNIIFEENEMVVIILHFLSELNNCLLIIY